MQLIYNYIKLTKSIIPREEQRKLKIISLGFVLLSVFDFIGVILLGSVGTIGYRLISGDSAPSRIELILNKSLNLNLYTLALLLTIAAIFFLGLKTVLTALFNFRLIKFLSRQESNLSLDLFEKVLYSKYRDSVKNSQSDYQWAIMIGSNRLIIGVVSPLLNFSSDVFSTLLLVILAFYASPIATLTVVTILFLSYLIISKSIHSRASKLGESITNLYLNLNKLIFSSIKGKKEITVYSIQDDFMALFDKDRFQLARENQTVQWLNGLFRYFMELALLFAGSVTVIVQLAISDRRHAITVIVVFMMIGFRLIPSIQRLQSTFLSLRISEPMIKTFLTYSENINLEPKTKPEQANPKTPICGMNIVNLYYKNEENNKDILNDINIKLAPGQLLAITGQSGSGKSTLIDIICGLIDPTKGKIEFTNNDGSYTKKPRIAYAPQNPFILPGDLYKNISFGTNRVNPTEIEELINLLDLEKIAARLDTNSKNHIVEDGNNLSGGEKQRIGIARAIYSERNFIVLDEPTSALDSLNQDKVIDYLVNLKKNKTIVFATHNPKLVSISDIQIKL